MTPDEILRIPLANPAALFSRDADERRRQYRDLAKRVHPDVPGGSAEVFAHLNELHHRAEAGNWDNTKLLTFTSRDGKHLEFRYRVERPFELGAAYIGRRSVVWHLRSEHDALLVNAVNAIGSIRFPDEKLRKQHQPFIPAYDAYEDAAGNNYLRTIKPDGTYAIADVVRSYGHLDPRHAAWMISAMLNLLCFYEIAGFTHNGLTPLTVFIKPDDHTCYPLGGWFYSLKAKRRLKVLPPEVYAVAPHESLSSKIADIRIDLASVRAIAKAVIGDLTQAAVPRPLALWLRLPPARSALDDYRGWERVRADSWGARKFLKLEIDPEKVYG